MADKVTVITGASGGIGAALARILGCDGHSLVLGARREKELNEVASKIGSKALPVVSDVTRLEDIERLRDAALNKFGRIDVWVNNAGRGIVKEVADLTEDDLDAIFDVNLKSVFYSIKAVVPYFKERGVGHMINVSSFLGRVPLMPSRSAYNAAKAALNVLSANLRMNLQITHPGIHVSVVMPGVTATDFAKNALYADPETAFWSGGNIQVQSAEEVAGIIASVIENPVPEVYTVEGQAGLANKYYSDIAAFEEVSRQRAMRK